MWHVPARGVAGVAEMVVSRREPEERERPGRQSDGYWVDNTIVLLISAWAEYAGYYWNHTSSLGIKQLPG